MRSENNDLVAERNELENDLSSSKEVIETIASLFNKMTGRNEEGGKDLMDRLWKGTLELELGSSL